MSNFKVRFFWGDYADRQAAANKAEAVCYIEHHFNSAGPTASGAEVIVASNASAKSRDWAADYAANAAAKLKISLRSPETKGVIVGGYDGRGDGNLRRTSMPAILVEPCFVSNPIEAALVKSDLGQNTLAQVLADSIVKAFPNGGLVAFSVGHKGKESNPADMGASVSGGGTEAEYAEKVLLKAQALLEGTPVPDKPIETVPDEPQGLSEREQMAAFILNFEARRDAAGHLTVYMLPSGDGGGTYEVAGINDRYDPRAAPRLRDMVKAGQYEAAEHYAREYIAGNTDVARSWFDLPGGGNTSDHYPGIEFYLRDCVFNRGAGGAAKILQQALGVGVDGGVGTITRTALQEALTKDWRGLLKKLRASREWYERKYAHRDESSKFWKGLVNRWDNAMTKALSFA